MVVRLVQRRSLSALPLAAAASAAEVAAAAGEGARLVVLLEGPKLAGLAPLVAPEVHPCRALVAADPVGAALVP